MTSKLKKFINSSFKDHRGYYWTNWKKDKFKSIKFNHDKFSLSKKNVLRGMHLQTKNPQAKFISVVKGKILDVVIDCRKKSKTYGKHFKIILSDQNCKSLYVPAGFAHGFCPISRRLYQ